MRYTANDLSVSTNDDGNIVLSQTDGKGTDVIIITPEQIGQVIEWLEEARRSLVVPKNGNGHKRVSRN